MFLYLGTKTLNETFSQFDIRNYLNYFWLLLSSGVGSSPQQTFGKFDLAQALFTRWLPDTTCHIHAGLGLSFRGPTLCHPPSTPWLSPIWDKQEYNFTFS